MQELKFLCDQEGVRLDAWLLSKLNGHSRTFIQKLIVDNCVTINLSNITKSSHKTKLNDEVTVIIPDPQQLSISPEDIDISILYEDNDIIVINKPKGMVVHPAPGNYSGTLVNALMKHCYNSLSDINGVLRPGIVHRLDKDTSGVLVVAKNNQSHQKLSELFKKHDITRRYVAIISGVPSNSFGMVNAPISRDHVNRKKMCVNITKGRRAVTYFKVLETLKNSSYINLELETGRTHQIRVHMAYIGHPILGDPVYGKPLPQIAGQALHAHTLGFIHPTKSAYIEFSAEPPLEFQNLLKSLKE